MSIITWPIPVPCQFGGCKRPRTGIYMYKSLRFSLCEVHLRRVTVADVD